MHTARYYCIRLVQLGCHVVERPCCYAMSFEQVELMWGRRPASCRWYGGCCRAVQEPGRGWVRGASAVVTWGFCVPVRYGGCVY